MHLKTWIKQRYSVIFQHSNTQRNMLYINTIQTAKRIKYTIGAKYYNIAHNNLFINRLRCGKGSKTTLE